MYKKQKKEKISWTKELCLEVAKKYNKKSDFKNQVPGAYGYCLRKGYINEVTQHMKAEKILWTKEECHKEALKYKTRKAFFSENGRAYGYAARTGILDEVCSHMVLLRKKWSHEKVRIEALKYKSRRDFQKYAGSAHHYAIKNKILDEVCYNMIPLGNSNFRMIYSYEFPDKTAYVGLTYNEEKRKSEHLVDKRGPVAKYILETGLQPEYQQLSCFLTEQVARIIEREFVEEYKSKGWKVLNSTKAGALGGNTIKWTKEEVKRVAQQFKRRVDFQKSKIYYTAYSAACKRGWLEYVCEHMIPEMTYWNKEKCLIEAQKYNKRSEFSKKSGSAWNYCIKNGFLEEACAHMDIILKKWTKEECIEEALKYSTRTDFQNKSKGGYLFALRRGWLDELCSHMEIKINCWDKETCKLEASNYSTLKDFREQAGGAHNYSKKKRFFKEITSHFRKRTAHNLKWTKEKCAEEALKFKTRGEFKLKSPAYQVALKYGWIDEVCKHMINIHSRKPALSGL